MNKKSLTEHLTPVKINVDIGGLMLGHPDYVICTQEIADKLIKDIEREFFKDEPRT